MEDATRRATWGRSITERNISARSHASACFGIWSDPNFVSFTPYTETKTHHN